jgi:hypothetical protein
VQLLFGFLFTAPFTERFMHVSELVRWVYFAAFLFTTAASAFLIAPSVYHRLHWRRDVKDKEQMFQIANRLAVLGVVCLAQAMTCAVFVLSTLIFDRWLALVLSTASLGLFGVLWFALPLSRRARERTA